MDSDKYFPKFLAFLRLFYPTLYKEICLHSDNSDLVEADLLCSNSNHLYQTIVFSEDVAKKGELFEIYTGKDSLAPYSWDWRWVNAVKILFGGEAIFSIKFKQKVIALPTGNHPLSSVFFDTLKDEFENALKELVLLAKNNNASILEGYAQYQEPTRCQVNI